MNELESMMSLNSQAKALVIKNDLGKLEVPKNSSIQVWNQYKQMFLPPSMTGGSEGRTHVIRQDMIR